MLEKAKKWFNDFMNLMTLDDLKSTIKGFFSMLFSFIFTIGFTFIVILYFIVKYAALGIERIIEFIFKFIKKQNDNK